MAFFEILSGLFLIATTFFPFQNYELMLRFTVAALGFWVAALLIFRSRSLFSTGVFFHFSIVLAYFLRATMADGSFHGWFFWMALIQWVILLYFVVKNPETPALPSLFLMIALISPFYYSILNAAGGTFPGIAVWSLLILRIAWISLRQNRNLTIPWFGILFLFFCAISIPFSLYPGRSVQFLILNALCLLAYSFSFMKHRAAYFAGFFFLVMMFGAFGVWEESFLFKNLGMAGLTARISIVMHHNDLVPVLVLSSCMLAAAGQDLKRSWLRSLLLVFLILSGLLVFFTWSRNGWVSYSVFLLCLVVSGKSVSFRKVLVGVSTLVALMLAVLLFSNSASRRFFDAGSAGIRWSTAKAGLTTIAENPVFGIGWLNFYAHAKIPAENSLSGNLGVAENGHPLQSHSMILDLSEAAGIPIGVTFLFILWKHLKKGNWNPALRAGLAGIAVNCVFDSAAFWLTFYPQFWILLGALGSKIPSRGFVLNRKLFVWILSLLYLGAFLSPVITDYNLQLSSFYHRNNQDTEAVKKLQIAKLASPLDVAALADLKEIYLTHENAQDAERILQKMILMKREFAPYYAELGRLQLLLGDYDASLLNLISARRLDPHSRLPGATYFSLASLARQQRDQNQFEEYLSRSLLLVSPGVSMTQLKELVHSMREDELLETVLRYASGHTRSNPDWSSAVDNFRSNLMLAGESQLVESLLERILFGRKDLPQADVDYYCTYLAGSYYMHRKYGRIKLLYKLVSPKTAPVIAAYDGLGKGDILSASLNLQESVRFFDYFDLRNEWDEYFRKLGDPFLLETHYQILSFVSPVDSGSSRQTTVADALVSKGKFAAAAELYHDYSYTRYDDPLTHWREARLWWLAGNKKKAGEANHRMLSLISNDSFTENLYKTDQETIWNGSGVMRVSLPNRLGGHVWRTVIYAHPPSRITFSLQNTSTCIAGEIALLSPVWDKETDGVGFEISDSNGTILWMRGLDPAHNLADRRWNSFRLMLSGPQSVVLTTNPGKTADYDWAVWVLEDCR